MIVQLNVKNTSNFLIPNILKKKHNINISLPEKWSDLSTNEISYIAPLLLNISENQKLDIFKMLITSKLKENDIRANEIDFTIDFETYNIIWSELYKFLLNDLENGNGIAIVPYESINIKGESYCLPSDGLYNITAGEFHLLTNYFKSFVALSTSKNATDKQKVLPLYRMLGVVARKRRNDLSSNDELFKYDIRQPLDVEEKVSGVIERSNHFIESNEITVGHLNTFLTYYTKSILNFNKRFKIFKVKSNSNTKEVRSSDNDDLPFGWKSVMLRLIPTGDVEAYYKIWNMPAVKFFELLYDNHINKKLEKQAIEEAYRN